MRNRTARRARPTNLSNRGIGTLPWSYFVVIAICGCVIAAGFLLAARQHFMSMDLGMKNSKLRKQLDDLESENRRLTLAREIALSPMEITRTARNFGFVDVGEIPVAIPASAPILKKDESGVLIKAVAVQSKPGDPAAPTVTKTAFQRPSGSVTKPDADKKTASVQALKKADSKAKPSKTELTALAKR